MTEERLDFGRRRSVPGWRRLAPMVVGALLIGSVLLARVLWPDTAPEGILVEVQGEVPAPGWHRVDPPTVTAALAAAGVPDAGSDAPVSEGDRVRHTAEGITVHPAGNPLLVALPVDLNTAGPQALEAVPGIGETLAVSILEDRVRRGPYYAVSDLARVRGVGPDTVEALSPLLTVGDIGPRPPPRILDLNDATATELEHLPGIGPVLAARIVVDRADRGPFHEVADLDRVKGVGEGILAGLEERVTVRDPDGADRSRSGLRAPVPSPPTGASPGRGASEPPAQDRSTGTGLGTD